MQMSWDVIKWARDYHLRYTTSQRWIQMNCPFCGDSSLKGGFSKSGTTMFCFKCGSHPVPKAVSLMVPCSLPEAYKIINKYKGHSSSYKELLAPEVITASKVDLPGRKKMRKKHRNYLIKRGFDPDKLTKKWGLRFTGPEEDYLWRWRIIFPIFYKGELVSFQGRDVTEKEDVIRYRGATAAESIIHYKKLLYGIERCYTGTVVVVEGIFDMFNFGDGAVCTFGTSLTKTQISLLAEQERVVFLFDPDDNNAWKKAKQYVLELRTLFVKAERIWYEGGDPGSLSKDKIKKLRDYIGIGEI